MTTITEWRFQLQKLNGHHKSFWGSFLVWGLISKTVCNNNQWELDHIRLIEQRFGDFVISKSSNQRTSVNYNAWYRTAGESPSDLGFAIILTVDKVLQFSEINSNVHTWGNWTIFMFISILILPAINRLGYQKIQLSSWKAPPAHFHTDSRQFGILIVRNTKYSKQKV